MESVPKTLDWVTARAECSIERLFMLLTEVMDSDVKTMQARAPVGTQFSLNQLTAAKIVIAKVTTDRQGFTAKPSLDSTGTCRLEVGGQPMELWQVSPEGA